MSEATPLRVGLIGAGSISRAHIEAYQRFPDVVRLEAVCDVDEAAARAAAEQTGAKAVYTDPETMLEAAAIDAVDICTPHDLHAPIAIAAATAGKHVLLEKPMACSMEECRAIVAAAEQAGVTLMIAQHFRYLPAYRGLKQLVESGDLGRVWAGRIDEFLPTSIDRRPRADAHWYNDGKRAGGGVVTTQSTHHIDLFRYLFGDVERVSAFSWTDHPAYSNGAEDSALATLEFENGMKVQLCASNSTLAQHAFQFAIYGTEGSVYTSAPDGGNAVQQHQAPALMTLYAEHSRQARLDLTTAFVPVEPNFLGLACEAPFVNEIVHFAECCRDGSEPISSGRDNLGTMKAVFGIYQSARAGGERLNLSAL